MTDQPDPPDQWRVYQGDETPDPEPGEASTQPQPPSPAFTPYGDAPRRKSRVVVRSFGVAPGCGIMGVIIGIIVVSVGISIVVAIVSSISDGIDSIPGVGGIDAKDPDDFEEFVEKLEDERGDTDVFWVGLYDGYIIADVPYSDDPADDREVSYVWRGGDLEESNKSTSTETVFDLSTIDPAVIDGLCDPVLSLAEGATEGDCYVFMSQPTEGSETWFTTTASDEFGRSYRVNFDKDGNEIERFLP